MASKVEPQHRLLEKEEEQSILLVWLWDERLSTQNLVSGSKRECAVGSSFRHRATLC